MVREPPLDEGDDEGSEVEVVDDVPSLKQQATDLKNLSFELKEFKGTVAKRNLQDSYRFAEIAEYEDYKLNVANTCRVMVTGNKTILLLML